MRFRKFGNEREAPKVSAESLESWIPKTQLGRRVKAGELTSIDDVLASGKKILEPQIVDILLPDLGQEVLDVRSTQRMTACGRKQAMQAVVALGNRRGYVAVGIGKAPETRDAIAEAVADAKKKIVRVPLGCGSWECGCGAPHSVPIQVSGSNSSTFITIKPAPRGVGLVAGKTAKKVLALAGVADAWTFSKGRTRNILNCVLATIDALSQLNRLKGSIVKAVAEPEPAVAAEQAEAAGQTGSDTKTAGA